MSRGMDRSVRAWAACGVLALTGAASADVVFQLNMEFSGGQAPAGSGPWLTATFAQNGTDNVRLTLASALTGSEFVGGFYFNVEPFTGLTSNFNAGLSSGTFATPAFNQSLDAFQADGDGLYDVLLDFAEAPPGDRFGGSDVAVFDFTAPGLMESFFDALSAPAGGHGPFNAAAHIQGIGENGQGSGWISNGEVIPLPPAAWAGLSGLALLGAGQRLRRRRLAE